MEQVVRTGLGVGDALDLNHGGAQDGPLVEVACAQSGGNDLAVAALIGDGDGLMKIGVEVGAWVGVDAPEAEALGGFGDVLGEGRELVGIGREGTIKVVDEGEEFSDGGVTGGGDGLLLLEFGLFAEVLEVGASALEVSRALSKSGGELGGRIG